MLQMLLLLLRTGMLLRKMVLLQSVLVRLPLRMVVDAAGRRKPPYIFILQIFVFKNINKFIQANFARISLTALFCCARGKIISEGGVKIGK